MTNSLLLSSPTLVEEVATELSALNPKCISPQPPMIASVSSDENSMDSSFSSGFNQVRTFISPSPMENTLSSTFPSACLNFLRRIPGNNRCVDCSEANPQWASVSYGVLLCLFCSGRHRSFGVRVSKVQSITMDSWSQQQILCMLEGGNDQLSQFFDRHSMGPSDGDDNNHIITNNSSSISKSQNVPSTKLSPGKASRPVDHVIELRYKTKAAKFYRDQLAMHVAHVLDKGEYKGREANRSTKAKLPQP